MSDFKHVGKYYTKSIVVDPSNFAQTRIWILDPTPDPAWIWPNIEKFQPFF